MGKEIKHPGLLYEIERFLAETSMGPSYFGKKAVGNSEVVSRLRAGRRIGLDTAERIRLFILNERQRPSDCRTHHAAQPNPLNMPQNGNNGRGAA